ncbi:hypothetical protein [Bifidobacterium minimum]|nr:hypothetical protein [Bifidobacterium minimum]
MPETTTMPGRGMPVLDPPRPPLVATPAMACSDGTDTEILWSIARDHPDLRRWIVANPRADAHLLEFIAQAGGPGVTRAITALLDSLESDVPLDHGQTPRSHGR